MLQCSAALPCCSTQKLLHGATGGGQPGLRWAAPLADLPSPLPSSDVSSHGDDWD